MNVLSYISPPKNRPSRIGGTFALLGAALPLLALANSKAIVPVTAVAVLAMLWFAFKEGRLASLLIRDRVVMAGLGGLIVCAAAASAISGAWPEAAVSLVKLTGLVVLGILIFPCRKNVTDDDIPWVAYGVIAGLVMTMLLIVGYVLFEKAMLFLGFKPERYNDTYFYWLSLYGYFWLKPAATVMAVASLIAGTALARRKRPLAAIILIAACALLCAWIGSRTASIGVVASLVAAVFYQLIGRYRLKLMLAAMALIFLLPLVLAASDFKPAQVSAHLNPENSSANSIVYRMHIWSFVTDKILEKSVLGWGAGASKRLGNDDVGQVLDPKFGTLGEAIPVHPHNAVLQVWLEFGGLGALLAFVLIARWLTLAERRAQFAWQRICVFSVGALIACFYGFNFSMTSSWWLVTVFVSIAVTTILARPEPPAGNTG
ncbi:MAG: O-antigen ligase family protein [Rhodospirillales bacterium]|nr:O-antigen ligase family protein [Rhodospirillales bacterium]MBO6787683.1 O-antigen ligase family protein [Rhodospirillales bacterium]